MDSHIESVKGVSEDLEKLAMSDNTVLAIPPEITSRLQSIRQGLVLQRETADGQRVRWIGEVDQHLHFLSEFLSKHSLAVDLVTECTRNWDIFRDTCKVLRPSSSMILWTSEIFLYNNKLHEILNEISKLNERYPLICASMGSNAETRISATVKKLTMSLKTFEEITERRQSLIEKIELKVNDISRNEQIFRQAVEALSTSLQQILGASFEPTKCVLGTLLEDCEIGLSRDLKALEQEKSLLQNLTLNICGDVLTTPILEPIENELEEDIKWEKMKVEKIRDPPENRALDVTNIVNELTKVKDSLTASINVSHYYTSDLFYFVSKCVDSSLSCFTQEYHFVVESCFDIYCFSNSYVKCVSDS